MGKDCSRTAEHLWSGVAKLLRLDRSAGGSSSMIPHKPQPGNLGDEVGGNISVGQRTDLEVKVPHAKEPETQWCHGQQQREAHLEVLPAEDRIRLQRIIFILD